MRATNWKDIAELVGISAIVVSLVFVGIQLRQDREIAELEGRTLSVANTVELASVFNDNEEIWRKGLLDQPLLESEQYTFDMLVRVLHTAMANQYGRRSLGIHARDPLDIPRSLAIYMYQYPGLKRGMMSLDAKLTAMVDAGAISSRGGFLPMALEFLAEFEESQPHLPPPDFIVF